MEEEKRRKRGGGGSRGCGCGCAGFLLVLTVGIILTFFNTDIGIGVSVRVPFTSSNLTVAGAIGTKSRVDDALPGYTHGRLAGNQNLINHSQTMTVGPAEGVTVTILGRQPGAPVVDLFLTAR